MTDTETFKALCAEAKDLMKRLEGSTVHSVTVELDDANVEVGQTVGAGDTVCIVEAMKLMNEVAASEGGKVAEIVVQNGERVEFEQVLMYLEPAE